MHSDVQKLLADIGARDFPYQECRRAARSQQAVERWGLLIAARDALIAGREGREIELLERPVPLEEAGPTTHASVPPPSAPPPGPARTGRSLLDQTRIYAAFGARAEGGQA